MTYRKNKNLIIRSMQKRDITKFVAAFNGQNWYKPKELFEGYYNRQENFELRVLVAEMIDEVAGYVTLHYNSTSGPFANNYIPEIVDLNVLIQFQKKGIGNMLMKAIEKIAIEKSKTVSLAVGLHYGYGPAQRMYVKRGYIPDGSGVWYKGKQLEQYKECMNDDDLLLYFLKYL